MEVLKEQSNFEFSLISGYPGEPEKEHVDFEWIHYSYKGEGFLANLYCAIRLLRDRDKIDILHIHQPLIGFLAHVLMPSATVRLYHFHSFWEEEKKMHSGGRLTGRWVNRFKGLIEKFVLTRMHHFIVLSEFSKVNLQRLLPEAKISIISGSVEIKTRGGLRKPCKKTLKLLSVRRLEPRMGLDVLIEAMAKLRDSEIELHLNIVGQGREFEHLEQMIDSLDLKPRVKLLGRLSQAELDEQLQQHHGMVIPSRSLEGFGMSVIEAFEAGLPVLATRVGALKEFEKHEGAFYAIAEPNVDATAQAIASVIQPWQDVEARTKACRQVAETYYSHATMAKKLTQLYRELS